MFVIEGRQSQTRLALPRQFEAALRGTTLSLPTGLFRTALKAKYTTSGANVTLATFDNTGFVVKDTFSVVSDYSEVDGSELSVKQGKIVTVDGGGENLTIDEDLLTTFVKGSMVIRHRGLPRELWYALAYLESIGAKAAFERPTTPTGWTATAIAGSPRKFRVVIPNPHKLYAQKKTLKFRVFIRPTAFNQPHYGWFPDKDAIEFGVTTNDASAVTSKKDDDNISVDISTHSGGADCLVDPPEWIGGGTPEAPGTLTAETPYFISVVAYSGPAGERQKVAQNESAQAGVRYVSSV
jgi:hypothetical protein